MDVVHERCCGLDVHKVKVVACLLRPGMSGEPTREVRTYGTTTKELLALGDWLGEAGVTHVGMESTGSFWKPIYNLFEGRFGLTVVNSRHLKLIPGRKSDVKDAEWIADLLRHGLLRASLIPTRPERELRELTRYRMSLLQMRASEVNRLQKVLEGANIKLGSVAANVVGVSGRAMLNAIIAGDDDPAKLAKLARGTLKRKTGALEEALRGRVEPHQRFMLQALLRHIEEIEAHIEEVNAEIEERLRPHEEAMERLETIPGVGRRTAETLLSEVGTEMSRFPTSRHLASWAGVCPGLNESAGKNRSGRTPHGSMWLKVALIQAAHAAGRSSGTYLSSQYRRLAGRIGPKKAAMAVAHSILVIAYRLLSNKETYKDLGPGYYDERNRERTTSRLTQRLEQLGYRVTIEPAAGSA